MTEATIKAETLIAECCRTLESVENGADRVTDQESLDEFLIATVELRRAARGIAKLQASENGHYTLRDIRRNLSDTREFLGRALLNLESANDNVAEETAFAVDQVLACAREMLAGVNHGSR
ncbi:MAG: hypothetical protein ACOY0T_35620 [Myxococcota bacterium]